MKVTLSWNRARSWIEQRVGKSRNFVRVGSESRNESAEMIFYQSAEIKGAGLEG